MRWSAWQAALSGFATGWPTITWNWTRRKLGSSGWVLVSNWTSSVLKLWPFQMPQSCFQLQYYMANHVAALSRSCFFYIRQLKSIKQSLTPEAMKTLVYAFISSRIDYCLYSQPSVVNCFRGCKPSRTPLPVSSLGPEDLNTWHRYCINCIGYQYGNVFSTRRPRWCTNVGMVQLHLTCRHTACQLHRMTVGVT